MNKKTKSELHIRLQKMFSNEFRKTFYDMLNN